MSMLSQNIEMKEIKSPLIDKLDRVNGPKKEGIGGDEIVEKEPEDIQEGEKDGSTGEEMVPINDHLDRPSVKGAYRPIRNGNINGSIIALIASAIATGTLNLPIRAHQLGLIPYTIVLTLSIALSYFGMVIMEWIILKHKVQSYAQMVNRAFGSRAMVYSQYALIFYTWGIAICIEVIFIRFTSQLFNDMLGVPLYANRDRQTYTFLGQVGRVIIAVCMSFGNAKYLMMTDLKEVLQKVGRSSIVGILFCMSIIWLTALFGFTRDYQGSDLSYQSIFRMDYTLVQWWQPWNSDYLNIVLQASTGVYFTMLNPQFVFPLVSHLRKPTRRRVNNIFKWAHIEELIIYMLLGWLGYLLLAQHQDILPISQLVISSIPTWPLLVGKFMLVFALFFRLPLLLFTTKEFIYQSLDIPRCPENYKKMNIWLVTSSMIVAILFENVNMYFSFIGGTLGVGTAAVIPLICAYKLVTFSPEQRIVVWFVIVMSLIIFLGSIQSLFYQI